ncbi:Peptide transport system ATP-binding protein SapF [Bibersteinia trehalosi USDA-ARS-USMARC-188]|uniref:Peptide transport system ATP-binding protein SapF n=3 Tax=Bibersteinia trehalosi TaxID=47735 RepID=A0A4V7IAX8_BIBTR|nr:ATP-binding cassette domain-containing protein [Bibersteinia trehalosi]AGH38044.1 Peptide transport system ATP-binding protein SapF [Bibersteinia trehalosi USDA-ARS-USMARC-192]AHG82156.1 Peptide transport system ATP-binding protein SapF [Bibersteinia trehalosi USDA-ARS-USMARC-188]AHG84468.1 Peptide transport system ATP-binding protein SapF [Bibersteinia trehalosi USDA-ARS-USMARC-189]OAQ15439.1 peptide ABC transporter ATP-binding protein [Bibersteinia trehalosi Y31]TCT13899.1 cationic peptid
MPLLEVRNLNKRFTDRISLFRKQDFYAVKNVSFSLNYQETLAVIGDNGAGKSTLVKMIAGIVEPTAGEMLLKNMALTYGDYKTRAKHIRMIFQDPNDAFDPNLNIGQILELPLKLATQLNEEERNQRIFQTLKLVGLYPEHSLIPIFDASNSQKQRVALARALILHPDIIIVDDTLTALDFSVKSQLTNLLLSLQERLGLSYLYVGQNLGLIKHLSDKLMVMDRGEVVEYGKTKDILLNPQHPLTMRLIESHFGKSLTEEAWAS